MNDHRKTAGSAPQATYSVAEFCAVHGIGRTSFYEAIKAGRAPRLMRVGRRVLVTAEAASDWRRDMEAATAAEAGR